MYSRATSFKSDSISEMDDKLADEVNIYKPIIVSGSINVGSNSFDVADSGYIITSQKLAQ